MCRRLWCLCVREGVGGGGERVRFEGSCVLDGCLVAAMAVWHVSCPRDQWNTLHTRQSENSHSEAHQAKAETQMYVCVYTQIS